MAQQTAVEYLIELNKNRAGFLYDEDFEKAKEIEKEQIINSYFQGFKEGRGIDKIDVSGTIFIEDTNAERYYETTYQPNENHSPKEI